MYTEGAYNSEQLNTRNGQRNTHFKVLRCANCDIDILWTPVIVRGHAYCCTGCAAGGPCSCDYSQYHSVNISGVIHYTPESNNAG
ncbi:MAG TPA: hypothetical protein VFA41_00945 [Ktedonobacteraceae bacterium]|nr:hypothetical protein [Ktedonobacteraceae bacterium]